MITFPQPSQRKADLFKRFIFARTTHEADAYMIQAQLEEQGFQFVPFNWEVE